MRWDNHNVINFKLWKRKYDAVIDRTLKIVDKYLELSRDANFTLFTGWRVTAKGLGSFSEEDKGMCDEDDFYSKTSYENKRVFKNGCWYLELGIEIQPSPPQRPPFATLTTSTPTASLASRP